MLYLQTSNLRALNGYKYSTPQERMKTRLYLRLSSSIKLPHAKYNVLTTLKIHGNLPNALLKITRRLIRNKLTIWHYKIATDVPAPLNAQPHSWLANQTRLQLALYARRKYLGAYHYALCISPKVMRENSSRSRLQNTISRTHCRVSLTQ